jgi:hypothetical protein
MNKTVKVLGVVAAVAAIAALLYFGDHDVGEKVVEEFDRTDRPLILNFVVYDSQREMEAAHKKQLGVRDLGGRSYGFAVWYEDETGSNECTLHVMKPQTVDDEITLTWGHELAHCVYGLYHEQEHK